MGVSTDGQICYGVMFDEDFEFPWLCEEFSGDEDEWWLVASGYKYDGPELFKDGWYIEGLNQDSPEVRAYFASRATWREAHPMPVRTVNYCSYEYPMYIIATPSSFKRALRGYAEKFAPSELVPNSDEVEALIKFCREYLGIEDAQPEWYLSSLWG